MLIEVAIAVIAVGLVVAVVLLLLFLIYVQRIRKFTKNIPKTKSLSPWTFANFCLGWMFSKERDVNFELWSEYSRNVKHQNRISCMWAYLICIVDLSEPRYIKTLLNSHQPHASLLTFPYGLLSLDGDAWHQRKKILGPSFGSLNVRKLIPEISVKCESFMKVLAESYTGKTFNVARILTAFSIDVFLKTSLRVERDFTSDPNNHLLDIIKEETLLINRVIYNLPRLVIPHFWIRTKLDCFVDELMPEIVNNARTREGSEEHFTFVESLLEHEDSMKMREIRKEIKGFIMAGTGTIAFTASTILLMIAMFPEAQAKVYAELMANCPNGEIDAKNIVNLKYLECVMNESMRLFPIILTYVRKVGEDLKLDDKITLPRNSFAIIRTKDVQRDPSIWGEDANEFKPERFFPENIKRIDQYAFHPFTLGPRMCIGHHYAKLMMKILIVNVVRNFRVKTQLKFDELELKLAILLRIKQNYMIELEKRD